MNTRPVPRALPTLAFTALLCAVLVVACDSPTGSDEPGPAAHVELLSGDLQTAEVGTELPRPLVVKVVDAKGKALAGQIVNFRTVSGGGTVFAGAAQTNADGIAQERWTLGTAARDTQRVEARAVNPATGQALVFGTFRAVGRAGAPAGISPVGPAARSGSAGAALGEVLQARVTDRFGNPVPAASVVWTVRSGGGSATPGTSTADSLGITGATWTLGPRVDSAQVVEAAATVAIKTAFTATAALPLGSGVVKRAGDGQTGTVGTKIPVPLKVAVLLPGGQPAVGATVSWSVGAGSGTIAPLVSLTDANGEATAEWTLGTAPGAQSASVSVAGAGMVTVAATAAAGPAVALAKTSGDAQTGNVGATLPAPLVARAVDAYGNPVPGAPLTWAVISGGGSLSSASAVTSANGTGSASWTLGAAPGAQAVRIASGALAPVDFTATANALITLTWLSPAENAVVADSVYVLVRASSTRAVGATATVENRTLPLFRTSAPEFSGWVPLAGLAPGTRELVVRATTASGDTVVARRTLIVDRSPVLAAPALEGTVARPGLRVDADCTDDAGPCTVAVYTDQGATPIASGTSGIHATLSLAAYDGRRVTVQVRATDSRGQYVERSYTVFVESSARWTEAASAPKGRLLDFDAGRLLYVLLADTNHLVAGVRLRDRASGEETVLREWAQTGAFTYNASLRGFLHPRGALFNADELIIWSPGTLQQWDRAGAVVSKGNWAFWSPGALHDLVNGTTAFVPSGDFAARTGYDVAPNGDAAWWTNETYDVFRYHAGTVTQLTNDDQQFRWNVNPLTDGVNVVYVKREVCCQTYQPAAIVLHDGTGETVLSADWPGVPEPHRDYEVNNGWTAYVLRDAAAVGQLWVRRPDGSLVQATHAASTATVASLGPNGELVYESGGRRYVLLAPYTGTAVEIGNAWLSEYGEGWMLWRGGSLYQVLGRSAFLISY
jgi:hypothetical protein